MAVGFGSLDGADEANVQFIIQIEQLLPKYRALYGKWLLEDPDQRSRVSLAHFAEDKLANMQAERFPTLAELKTHVYALGKIVGRPIRGQ